MVVEEVENLDAGAVGEEPVGDVGLPAFVGKVCLEADVGVAGALLRGGSDEPCGVQDAPDGRGGWGGVAFLLEVPGDRDGAGVSAGAGEFAAQLDDPLPDGVRGGAGPGLRGAGAGSSTVWPFGFVAADQGMHPLSGHAEPRRGFRVAQALFMHGSDDDEILRFHPSTMTRLTCQRSHHPTGQR